MDENASRSREELLAEWRRSRAEAKLTASGGKQGAKPGGKPGSCGSGLLRAMASSAEACGSRFLGFRVSPGAVRGLLLTAFTVAVGLWSVLKGAGVYVTVGTACPSGG